MCVDPESLVRGGSKFNVFNGFFLYILMRGLKYHRKRAIISPPAKRHLAGRWWHNIECWLGSFVIFLWIRTSIAKKPYIFQGWGGVRSPCPPPTPPPPPPLWIHPWCKLRDKRLDWLKGWLEVHGLDFHPHFQTSCSMNVFYILRPEFFDLQTLLL